MTDAEAKDHPPVGRVGNQGGMLRAKVRMAQIDVGNPTSNPDGLCSSAHQLNRGKNVVIDLGGKDGLKARSFRLLRDGLDFPGPPSNAWNDPQSQSLRHLNLPILGTRLMLAPASRG